MSYIRANTAPTFGSRAQAVRPLRLGGWYNGPYPVYGQPSSLRLNGEFVPIVAPATPAWQGMRTYRINPATGQYQFYTGDIRPRGIFPQNTFQHPQLSSLGGVIRNVGPAMARQGALMLPAPHPSAVTRSRRLFASRRSNNCGPSCRCGGRCQMGRLGDTPDTFIDPNTGCVMDTDGNLLTCPGGVDPYAPQAPTVPQGTLIPSSQRPTIPSSAITTAIEAVTGAVTGAAAAVRSPAPSPTSSSIFNGTTMIGSYAVPNSALLMGAGLIGVMALAGGGKRR